MAHISHNDKSDRLKKTCTYQHVQNNIASQGSLENTILSRTLNQQIIN